MLDYQYRSGTPGGPQESAHSFQRFGGGLRGAEHQDDWTARVELGPSNSSRPGKACAPTLGGTACRSCRRRRASSSTSSTTAFVASTCWSQKSAVRAGRWAPVPVLDPLSAFGSPSHMRPGTEDLETGEVGAEGREASRGSPDEVAFLSGPQAIEQLGLRMCPQLAEDGFQVSPMTAQRCRRLSSATRRNRSCNG